MKLNSTHPKILLVEDEPVLSQPLVHRLQGEGYAVALAQDGQEALQKLESEDPDLVLLDLCLPRQNGFETLEHIVKEKGKLPIPVIVLSNMGSEESIERARSFGITDYLVKTKTSHEEILERIRSLLDASPVGETSQ